MFGFGKDKKYQDQIQKLSEEIASIKNESTDSSKILKGSELWNSLAGQTTGSGVYVNERVAMSVAAIYACVGLIAGNIASLPLHIYERTSDGKKKVDHDLWWLLNEQPNAAWSSPVFWEFITQSFLLRGDSYARIIRKKGLVSDEIDSFDPLHPDDVTPFLIDGRLRYIIKKDSDVEIVDQDDMIHIPGLGFNGVNGLSQVKGVLAKPAGTAIAAEEFSGRFFKNSARPDYVLETDQNLKADQVSQIRDNVELIHGGYANAFKPAVFTNGLKIKPLTMTSEDAQLIQTRGFQDNQIAMIFGVPGHMIGLQDKTSSWGTGIEQLSIGFVKFTLKRHLVKIEKELNRKCFRTAKYFAEYNVAGLERGDYKSRNEGYRIALGRAGEPGWMSPNEIRKLENMPPIDGGDEINKGVADASVKPITE